jgi:hypothetical protein
MMYSRDYVLCRLALEWKRPNVLRFSCRRGAPQKVSKCIRSRAPKAVSCKRLFGRRTVSFVLALELAAQARYNPTRLCSIAAVVIAKVIQHHLLFARYAYEIQGQERHHTCRPSNPILQEQGLGKAQ